MECVLVFGLLNISIINVGRSIILVSLAHWNHWPQWTHQQGLFLDIWSYTRIIIFLKQNSLYLIPGFNIIKKFVATKIQPKIYDELVSFIVYMIIQLKMLFGRQPSS